MRAGTLRHVVSIQSMTETRNSFGEVVKTWATDSTKRAAIKPLSGNELVHAQQVHSETTHGFTMRYTSLSTSNRLLFDSRIFEILSILNIDERNRELKIMAKEVA